MNTGTSSGSRRRTSSAMSTTPTTCVGRAAVAKLWPKLIKASSVEAVAEIQKGLEHQPVTDESVKAFLAESEQASASTKDVTPHVRLVTREDDKNAFYETQDRSQKDGFVHRNYIRKQ